MIPKITLKFQLFKNKSLKNSVKIDFITKNEISTFVLRPSLLKTSHQNVENFRCAAKKVQEISIYTGEYAVKTQ